MMVEYGSYTPRYVDFCFYHEFIKRPQENKLNTHLGFRTN